MLVLLAVLVFPGQAKAQEKIILQLRWDHQFQFAGYYAALWQGYYSDAGLDVEIRSVFEPGGKYHNVIKEVSEGRAHFGIGSGDILKAHSNGAPLAIVASIFQQSAVAFYAKADAGMHSPADLTRLRVGTRGPTGMANVELRAMLRAENIDPTLVKEQPFKERLGIYDLAKGNVDVASGVTISAGWVAKQLGLKLSRLYPRSYGVDFYGDTLFTNQKFIDQNAALVKKFKEASLRGWQYALMHEHGIAERIAHEFKRKIPIKDIAGFNRFQAVQVKKLTLFPIVSLGSVNPARWQHMHAALIDSGLVTGILDIDKFIFNPEKLEEERRNFLIQIALFALISTLVLGAIGWIWTLKRSLTERRRAEKLLQIAHNELETRIEERTHDLRHQVAERKNAEESLRDSEELYKSLVDHFPDAIFIHDGKKILFANPGMLDLLEIKDKNDLLGQSPLEIVHKDDWKLLPLLNPTANVEAVSKLNEIRLLRLDGSSVGVECYRIPVRLLGKKAFLVFATDLSDRKEAEAAVLEAKNTADEANRAKSDFLSSMSHELRTPLNAILGFSQLLKFDKRNPLTTAQEDNVDQVLKGGNHLLELINEVLDLAKIEAGKVALSIEPVSLEMVIAECLDLTDTISSNFGITLQKSLLESKLPDVLADYTRVKQVLINLLSNAIKYNRKGGTVDVSCKETANNMFRISVTDTGRGIPEDKQIGLFKPFSRLGRETSDIEGTGIGLTVTKQLVELMEGRIGFESELNKGSTFWFELPLVSAKQAEAFRAIEERKVELELLSALDLKQDIDGIALYVEDNPANFLLMQKIFMQLPEMDLLHAKTAEEGLTLAKERMPRIILMDINLPGMNGYEALREIRRSKTMEPIPVIAITANAMPLDIQKGKEAGFEEYLIKPLDVYKTINVIHATLKKQPLPATGAIQ